MKMPGARIVLEALKREGVDLIFGLPGGAVLPIYDVLYDFEGLRHILVRQEAAAGHAAEGYARTTGKVGVCLVTSGPAATNLVTALQDALMDSIPIVAFTGQVPTHLIGNDAFQEADNVGITRPCTKHNFLVKDGKDLGPIIREAFHIASTGRPGPVHVDLPKDVLVKEAEFVWPERVLLRSYNPNYEGHSGQIKRAARLIVRAQRPVLYVGGGAISSDASAELLELAELTQIPVTTTLMGLGAFPSAHPLSLDMLGMHGSYYANMAVHHADVLVAVGARFDDRVTGKVEAFSPNAQIIHIDIDPSSISKNIKVDVPIVGDCRRVLRALVDAVREEMGDETPAAAREGRAAWHAQLAEWRSGIPFRYEWSDEVDQAAVRDPGDLQPHPRRGFHGDGCGPAPDVGGPVLQVHAPAAAGAPPAGSGPWATACPRPWACRPRNPGKLVINIDGDGSFAMNSQELATCFTEGLPVKTVIINNSGHGMVRQWQRIIYKERYCAIDLPGHPRLGQAGRGLRLRGHPGDQAERGGARHREDAQHAGPGDPRRVRGQGRVRVSHGARGRRQHRHDPGPPTREVREKAAKSQTGF